jgi:hypothetical protein
MNEMKQGFFLHELGYERNSFCELTVVKTDHRKLATRRWLAPSSMTVGTASGGAPAPRTPTVVTV